MRVLYTWYWRWGDKSTSTYDLDSALSRADLTNVLRRIKTGEESKEITHHEFHEIKRVSMDDLTAELSKYPS